jgi:hypothetical protein
MREGCGRENRVRYALPDPDLRQFPAAGKPLSRQRYRIVIELLTKDEFRIFSAVPSPARTTGNGTGRTPARHIQKVDFPVDFS